jgi:hypothetical protein
VRKSEREREEKGREIKITGNRKKGRREKGDGGWKGKGDRKRKENKNITNMFSRVV